MSIPNPCDLHCSVEHKMFSRVFTLLFMNEHGAERAKKKGAYDLSKSYEAI